MYQKEDIASQSLEETPDTRSQVKAIKHNASKGNSENPLEYRARLLYVTLPPSSP